MSDADGTGPPRPDRRRRLRRVHRPQGPGPQVRPPVPGARPTSASSCSAATAPASTRRRSRKGLQIVERQLRDRAVRSGEEELFKARARETGSVKIIDIISARLDAKTDSYLATLPSLQLKDVRIDDKLVRENERMLTGGFYAEVDLAYDAVDRPGEERPAVLDPRPAADPALEAGRAGRALRRAERVHAPPSGSTSCSAASAWSRPRLTERQIGRDAAPHGPVRREQLQPGRARPARHGQEPPVPADFALRPPRHRRQGDRRPDVREQSPPASAGWSASTTWSASTRSPASPSTRRTASTS